MENIQEKEDLKEDPKVNTRYLSFLVAGVALGSVQWGFCIVSWNVATNVYGLEHNWGKSSSLEYRDKQVVIQTLAMVGATVGALAAGPIAQMGRWRSIMLSNFIVNLAAGLKLVPNFPVFGIAWFLHGFTAGFFSFLTPKYISEVAPVKVSGSYGGVTQISVCLGILIASLFNPL